MPVHHSAVGTIATLTIENGAAGRSMPERHRQFRDHAVEFLGDRSILVGILIGTGVRPIAVARPRDTARLLADMIAGHPPCAVRVEVETFPCGPDAGPLEAIRMAGNRPGLHRRAMGRSDGVGKSHHPEPSDEARDR